jgi:hypothetical protein
MSPASETVAILTSDVVHVTPAPMITFPPESFTVAVRVSVAPSEENETAVLDSSMLAAA